MANGTIAFDTLSTSGQITGTAKSVDTDYVVSGSAKAWISFDAKDTVAVYHSLNHSALTDNGTGNFNNTLSNALTDGNYCFTASAGRSPNAGGTNPPVAYMADDAFAPTATAYRVYLIGIDGTLQDQDRNFQVLHGELA
tara:strand:+ start:288 stop:704 length:417 start_codon:yes stop_codon:yes gene_type:complete